MPQQRDKWAQYAEAPRDDKWAQYVEKSSSRKPQSLPPLTNGTRSSSDREVLLGTLEGAGFPETQTPLKHVASGLEYIALHPLDSAGLLFDAAKESQQEQLRDADDYAHAARESDNLKDYAGNVAGSAVKRVAGMVPLLGPAAMSAGEEIREGMDSGDPEKAAHGRGRAYGIIATLGLGRGKLGPSVRKGLTPLTDRVASGAEHLSESLPEKVRGTAQKMVGAGPKKTTLPALEEYKEKSSAVEQLNRKTTDEAFTKAGKDKAGYEKKVREQAEAHQKKVAEVASHNAEVDRVTQQRDSLARSVEEGSGELGESIKSLDGAMREEANARYDEVRKATKGDPGVPTADFAREIRRIETDILRRKPESVTLFRELLKRAPEAEGVMTSAGMAVPGDPLYDQLVKEGVIDQGGNMTFDDVKGYSSDIQSKLSAGNLPDDIYRGLKQLDEKLEAAKREIAKRNGVSDKLKEADDFYRQYQQVFYDKPSAVAASRERVGKLDPKHYAQSFISGKAAERGIASLRELKTRMPATKQYAEKVAAQAEHLRAASDQLKKLPTLKAKPMPEAPKPVERPAAVEVEYKPTPEKPTRESITEAKRKEIGKTASDWGKLHRYEIGLMVASPIATFFRSGLEAAGINLAADAVYVASKQLAASVLDRPRFVEWLSQPTAQDLMLIGELPDSAKEAVRGKMLKAVKEEQASGRLKTLDPRVMQFLRTGAVAGGELQRKGLTPLQ